MEKYLFFSFYPWDGTSDKLYTIMNVTPINIVKPKTGKPFDFNWGICISGGVYPDLSAALTGVWNTFRGSDKQILLQPCHHFTFVSTITFGHFLFSKKGTLKFELSHQFEHHSKYSQRTTFRIGICLLSYVLSFCHSNVICFHVIKKKKCYMFSFESFGFI